MRFHVMPIRGRGKILLPTLGSPRTSFSSIVSGKASDKRGGFNEQIRAEVGPVEMSREVIIG